MGLRVTRDECIEKLVSAIQASDRDNEIKDYLSFIVMVQFNSTRRLNRILETSNDTEATLDLINAAVAEVFGPDFQFTGHGFNRGLSVTYRNKEHLIIRHIQAFNGLLRERLNIHSFITSGTLLGMVREGRFLAHDDDIDLAYVSQHSDEAAVVEEREALLKLISEQGNMVAVNANGVIKIRYFFDDLYFDFDLFTGFCLGDFVNIYLQKPNTIPKAAILPLRSDIFYGEETSIPQRPEALLEVNYGPDWRTPDRGFRFNVNEHLGFYRFLLPEDKKNIELESCDA